ncbi:MAG TPA: TonB-dependent receptor [Bacteroidales bacterium]|nr:TonB-dependent receptor [Bacteroidales bacterium]
MRIVLIYVLLIIINISVFSQTSDTIILKEIIINSSRIGLSESQMLRPIQIVSLKKNSVNTDNSVSSVLKDMTAVDIRQRSFSSVQSDISIRGGSFDQSIVLLNGINLSDPQTGHHSLNIPVNSTVLEAAEIVYGPGSRIFGANALTGAVNFISSIPQKSGIMLDVSYGSFNTVNGDVVLNHVAKKFNQTLNFNYTQSDGFIHNTDYNKINVYYENNISLGKIKIKTMLGYLDKNFGAYSFYTPQYVNQYEKIRTGFGAVKVYGGSAIKWEYKAYYRGFTDEYQLFRESADYYQNIDGIWINYTTGDSVSWYRSHNNHFTTVAGTGFNLEKDWIGGKSAIGGEYRYEQIYSNVLGNQLDEAYENLYTKSDERQNITVFAEHGYYKNRILINAGAMAYYNQKYGLNFYYGGDAGYKITENFIVKAGVNKSMRLPTFTELYYQGAANEGNPNLVPEHAISIEVGTKLYFSKKSFINVNLYNRLGTNIISWVRESRADKWKTENLTELNTYGAEIFGSYRDFEDNAFLNNIGLVYSYIYQDKDAAGLESKYTLDHLKQKFVLNLSHKIYKNLSADFSLNIFKRNGEYLLFDFERNAYTNMVSFPLTELVNLKVTAEFNKIDIFLSGYNLTNQSYFDIANVPAPGIAVMGGVSVKL